MGRARASELAGGRRWLHLGAVLLLAALPAPPAHGDDESWRAHGPSGGTVIALAVSPGGAGTATIYAGTAGDGVWRSEDGGTSWQAARENLSRGTVTDLDVDPRQPGVVLAVTAGGLYRSEDRGDHWMPTGSPMFGLIARSPVVADVLYGSKLTAVWRSPDGGFTWQPTAALPFGSFLHDLAADPVDPDVAWLGSVGGVLRTTDGGAHWELLTEGMGDFLIPLVITAVAVDPATPAVVWAARRAGRVTILRSADRGESWQPAFVLPIPPDQAEVVALAVAPPAAGGPSRVLAAVNRYGALVRGELWRSEDDGATWERIFVSSHLEALVAVPRNGADEVLLGTTTSGVRTSDDGGVTFATPGSGLFALGGSALAVDPRDPRRWLAAVTSGSPHGHEGAGLRLSGDGGTSWQPASEGLARWGRGPRIDRLLHDPRRPQRVFAAGPEGVSRSRDGGRTWETVVPSLDLTDLLVDANGAWWAVGTDRVWCGVLTCGTIPVPVALRSRDGGDRWEPVQAGLAPPGATPLQRRGVLVAIAHDPRSRRWYVGGSSGCFVRGPRGRQWQRLDLDLEGVVSDLLVPHWPQRGSRPLPLYVAVARLRGPRILLSRDGGATFQPAADGLHPFADVRQLTAHLTATGTVFAATTLGVYVTRDHGTSWQQLGDGLAGRDVVSLAVVPGAARRPPTLLAGTANEGLFSLEVP